MPTNAPYAATAIRKRSAAERRCRALFKITGGLATKE
jgi:hypothetical protein